jgi:hypothetical protein
MKKKHHMFLLKGVLSIFFITALYGCSKDENTSDQTGMLLGEEITVGEGTARSFIAVDSKGDPQKIGFTFSASTLENLPMHSAMFEIAVPKGNNTMVDHISFDFNAHGHEPPGVYDVPHFDIHFYNISKAERAVIQPNTAAMDLLPSAEYIPRDYAPIPGGDINMGKHWTDTTGTEFHGKPFDKTFIYGSYNGMFIFHEAMVALSYLQTKPNVTMEVKQQSKVQVGGYYPSAFSITYDEAKQLYTVSMDNLQRRIAQ